MRIEQDKLIQAGGIATAQDFLRMACDKVCEATGDDTMADLLVDAWGDIFPEAIESLNLEDDQAERVKEHIGPFKPENRLKEIIS